jgi:hypothetical protein
VASLAPAPSPATPASIASLGRKLRVGVVSDVPYQPRWLAEALAKVAASGFAEIVWGQTTVSSRARNRGLTQGSAAWKAYSRLEQRIFGSGQWSRPADISAIAPAPRDGDENVDVIVVLGDVANEEISAHATFGVWRYCFGAEGVTCESHAGLREVLEGRDVTSSGIRVHLPGGDDRIVYQSWSRTMAFSASRNRDNMFAKASEFLVRGLRDLHREGPALLERAKAAPGAAPCEMVPGTVSVGRMAARVAQRAVEKIATVEQWSLAFRFASAEPWSGSLAGFHRLAPPGDGFWADPFPLQRGGKSYVFFEELPRAGGRAHISVIEVDRDGRASSPVRVLERDYHLSYPFLVEDGGQLYMVPESAENRTIEIYRCVDFPRKWRRERVLLDGIFAADATLHRHAGRWWMFANVAANGAEIHDELHLFTSESLLGEWTPLASNPVKSDVRGARPAGQLFEHDGHLYRPAQICAPLYGTGISLQRVTRLDEQGFAEQEERRILPAPGEGVLGLHTMNRAGDLSVTDAFVRRARFH